MDNLVFAYYILKIEYFANGRYRYPISSISYLIQMPKPDFEYSNLSDIEECKLQESMIFIDGVITYIKNTYINVESFSFTEVDKLEVDTHIRKFYRIIDGDYFDFIENKNLYLINLDFETVYFRNIDNKIPITKNTRGYIGFNLDNNIIPTYKDFSSKLEINIIQSNDLRSNEESSTENIFDQNIVI